MRYSKPRRGLDPVPTSTAVTRSNARWTGLFFRMAVSGRGHQGVQEGARANGKRSESHVQKTFAE